MNSLPLTESAITPHTKGDATDHAAARPPRINLTRLTSTLQGGNASTGNRVSGTLVGLQGGALLARIPQACIGDLCTVKTHTGNEVPAQVISFHEDLVSLAPLDALEGIGPGMPVYNSGTTPSVSVHDGMIGSVVDALGRPLDGLSDLRAPAKGAPVRGGTPLAAPAPNPLRRRDITEQLLTGVRSIDTLCSIGVGQRIGLFAGAGVGKSTLLGMIARNAEVDLTVIALIGERGREVNEFLHDSLGSEGLAKSVVVVATSDESSIRRLMAAKTATAIAEHYRRQGKRVLLLLDSLTRTARAMREVGLAAGEVPVRQGYTPSVYTELPRLLERAGNDAYGSITAIYTVLMNSEREADPLAEEIKSILDGHIVLSPSVAQQGIRPAVDLTTSVSRVLTRIRTREDVEVAGHLVKMLARLKHDRDVVLLGGTPDRELAVALELEPSLREALHQTPYEREDYATSWARVRALAQEFFTRSRAT